MLVSDVTIMIYTHEHHPRGYRFQIQVECKPKYQYIRNSMRSLSA